MSVSSNLARTTNDTCPWSVTDTHATLRRSRTRFDSWLGHYENNRSRLWPASVMDSTTDFESVRRGSTPWRAAQQQTARYANGIAAKLKPWCLWVRLPPVLLGVGTMKANKQFRFGWPMAEKRRSTMPRPWLSGWTVNVDWNIAAVEVDRRNAFIISLDAGKQTQTKLLWHGTRIGTAAKLKPSCLRVRLPPVLLEMNWKNNTARSSIGRTPVSHAGKMSSILIRVTEQAGNKRVGVHW